jgi:hypothetical protein
VSATNAGVTVVHTIDEGDLSASNDEDPLSKARVDLVDEAIRAGLDGLHALGPPPDPAADAAALAAECAAHPDTSSRVIVDLRGASAARLDKAAFVKDVDRAVAKGHLEPVERVWLFDGHTFDGWHGDALVDGIDAWGMYVVQHPVGVDLAVITAAAAADPALVYLLRSSGIEVYGDDATVCTAGAIRPIVDIAGASRAGVRVVAIP